MKAINMKATVAKVMAVGVVAAGLMMAAPAAQAQRFGAAVEFGGPRYVGPPVVYGPAFYPHRHEVFVAPYRPYFYGRWHDGPRFERRRW